MIEATVGCDKTEKCLWPWYGFNICQG